MKAPESKIAADCEEKSPKPFRWLQKRLQNRGDSEHEVSINRLAILLCILLFWTVAAELGSAAAFDALAETEFPFIACAGSGLLLLGHLIAFPAASRPRLAIGLFVDLAAVTWGVYLCGDAGVMLYPIYLWVILGYGFRFGVRYLFAGVIGVMACFSVVAYLTPYWGQHLEITLGLGFGLVIIPAYAARLIQKLSHATLAAEAASRAKSMFLAGVSHELRTPLNAIIGLSDMLQQSPLNADQSSMAHTIGRSGRSLLTLINGILDVSRMELGNQRVKVERIDLFEFLADIRDMLGVAAAAKGLRLSVMIGARTPRHVTGNASHLEEILVNLVGNAIKFTEAGFVVIGLEALPHGDASARLRFEVSDTGIGIAEEARERIFDAFAQADETIIDQYGGTGLGLALVKQIITASGGAIGVDSTPGEGSKFWFELPFADAEPHVEASFEEPVYLLSSDPVLCLQMRQLCPGAQCFDTAAAILDQCALDIPNAAKPPIFVFDERTLGASLGAAVDRLRDLKREGVAPCVWIDAAEPADVSPGLIGKFCSRVVNREDAMEIAAALRITEILCTRRSGKSDGEPLALVRLRILVAEDNRTNQLVIRKILESCGHTVALADNGEQALEQLGGGEFDLVFMDVNMPVLNGIETTKLARFVELEKPRVPIVALTADASEETRARCLEAGMDDCLTKPVERAHMVTWLARFCAGRLATRVATLEPVSDAAGAEPLRGKDSDLAPVDHRTLDDLEKLGGKPFVDQIIGQFVSDAASVLKELSDAVAAGDAHAFREQAHALRSCAANVGAQRVYELCLEWRSIDASEVAKRGEAHMRQLELEFERASKALAAF